MIIAMIQKSVLLAILAFSFAGCASSSAEEPAKQETVQQVTNWKAKDIWTDPQAVALGDAIEADDAQEI